MEDIYNGVPPTIEEAPKRDKKYGGIPDGHIDFWDDRKTMLEWATGKRGVRRDRASGREHRKANNSKKQKQYGQD